MRQYTTRVNFSQYIVKIWRTCGLMDQRMVGHLGRKGSCASQRLQFLKGCLKAMLKRCLLSESDRLVKAAVRLGKHQSSDAICSASLYYTTRGLSFDSVLQDIFFRLNFSCKKVGHSDEFRTQRFGVEIGHGIPVFNQSIQIQLAADKGDDKRKTMVY